MASRRATSAILGIPSLNERETSRSTRDFDRGLGPERPELRIEMGEQKAGDPVVRQMIWTRKHFA